MDAQFSACDELFDLKGRVALITGAGGGLGLAMAALFARHGATLALADRDPRSADAAVSASRRYTNDAMPLVADLSEPREVEVLCDRVLQHFGRVDVLVCNGGMQGPAGSLLDVEGKDWDDVFMVNLRSAHILASRLLPGMAARGGGSMIVMASIAALRGNKAIGLYGLTKAALAQLARNLAVEWGPRGVRVNAIAPGLIRTPLADAMLADEAFLQRRTALTPLRRVGEPHEVAGVALMLASRAGGFITGQTLVVDGGTLIGDGQ